MINCKGFIFNPYLIIYIEHNKINNFIKIIKNLKVKLVIGGHIVEEFNIFINLYLCHLFKLNLKIKKNKIKIPLFFLRTCKFPLFLLKYHNLSIGISHKYNIDYIKKFKIKILNLNYEENFIINNTIMFPFFICNKQRLEKNEKEIYTKCLLSTLFMLLCITKKQNNKKFPKIKYITLHLDGKMKNIDVEKIEKYTINKFNTKIHLIPIYKKFNNEKQIKKKIKKQKISNIRIHDLIKPGISFNDNSINIGFDEINTHNYSYNLYSLHNNEYVLSDGMGALRYFC